MGDGKTSVGDLEAQRKRQAVLKAHGGWQIHRGSWWVGEEPQGSPLCRFKNSSHVNKLIFSAVASC